MIYILGGAADTCIYCGEEIAAGDDVYDTGAGLVHDECFYEYMLQYARACGWRHYEYGGEAD